LVNVVPSLAKVDAFHALLPLPARYHAEERLRRRMRIRAWRAVVGDAPRMGVDASGRARW
jgi:hypothetical protein